MLSAADFYQNSASCQRPRRALIRPTVDAGPFWRKKGPKHTQESQALVMINWVIQKIIWHSSSDVEITASLPRAANEEVRICKRALPNTQFNRKPREDTKSHVSSSLSPKYTDMIPVELWSDPGVPNQTGKNVWEKFPNKSWRSWNELSKLFEREQICQLKGWWL